MANEQAPFELPMDGLDGVIFDLDGVITDTASVQAGAWKLMFDRFLADRGDRGGEIVELPAGGSVKRALGAEGMRA